MADPIDIKFQLFPWYVSQLSGMVECPEWERVARLLENASEHAFGVRASRSSGTKRWILDIERPPLSKIVDFNATFHDLVQDFPGVEMNIDVKRFSLDKYVLDMPLDVAMSAIARKVGSAAASTPRAVAPEVVAAPPESPEDIHLETEIRTKLDAPATSSEIVIRDIRERLMRNQITDAGAIRQLCDAVDTYESRRFTRLAFDALLREVEGA